MHKSHIFYIKVFHTAIFLFMVSCLLYILYCCITRTFDLILLIAIGAILLEGLVLIFNHWRCPFTDLAERYGAQKGSVTDLFVPDWMARHTFTFSTVFFACELIVLGFRYFSGI